MKSNNWLYSQKSVSPNDTITNLVKERSKYSLTLNFDFIELLIMKVIVVKYQLEDLRNQKKIEYQKDKWILPRVEYKMIKIGQELV